MNNKLDYSSEFGLYIHIPFCEKKCNYCDFYSITSSANDIDKFIKALTKEIESYSHNLSNKNVKTVYFGGGTPSILSSNQLETIVSSLNQYFNIKNNIEVSMEANPETLTSDKLKSYKKIGINRLSLGVQSFLDSELNFLGRIHDSKRSQKVIKEVKKHFDNFSLDLMFALPDQSLSDFKYSLNKALEYEPKHISLYNLQIEPNTNLFDRLNRGEFKEIAEETDYKMYNLAVEKLKSSDYRHYEISNFAQKGYQSKHNIIYWKYQPYLGLGPSAHGFNGSNRYYNYSDLNKYINRLNNDKTPIEEIVDLEKEDLISEMIFMGLRLINGVNKQDFKNRFDISIHEVYGEVINNLKDKGLLKEDSENIYLTKKGLNLGNVSFAEFLL